MEKKKGFKFFCSLIIYVIISLNSMLVYAENTKTELNDKMGDIDKQIDSTKDEIKEVKNEISDKMKEIQKLTNEISGYEDEIDDLNDELKKLQNSISEQEKDLKKAEEDYTKQKELLEKRLIAMYESGKTSYLDVLLSSEDITDFLSRYYLMAELADNDSKLLQKIDEDKAAIELKKENLEADKNKVEANKASKVKTSKALASAKSVKDKQVGELSDTEKELQAQLDQFEKDKREIQERLRKIAEEEAKKNKTNISLTPSASGYIRPIVGYPITTGLYYSNGSYHGAVDFSGSGIAGKPILAVKDGTVITSAAFKNSNGTYYSYGEYIIISHHDGTMTLYAHGQPGSRKVFEGQEVKQGQTIMLVGTTGNSTGYHLHFEVRVNGKRVDPRPYLP